MTTNTLYLDYNVTGADRKELVQAISNYTGVNVKYLGAPTFAYEVDDFHIDRNGVVSFDERVDRDELEGMVKVLVEQGFVSCVSNLDCEEEGDDPTEAQNENPGLTVTIPLDKVGVGNLTSLLEAKGELIKRALGITDLRFATDQENISFPWFEEVTPDEALAYTKFITALCGMSKKQKRVTAKPKENENEKYAFRCFLLRLGFIGDEFKADRKILLSRLDGSSAFKNGAKGGAGDEISE